MGEMISIVDSLLAGNTKVMERAGEDKEFIDRYGQDEFYLSRLSESQLENLRKDIPLCSLYVDDYENRYGIDPKQVCMFFDGYADYLSEIMQENNIDCDAFFENLDEFDTVENLVEWHMIVYGC